MKLLHHTSHRIALSTVLLAGTMFMIPAQSAAAQIDPCDPNDSIYDPDLCNLGGGGGGSSDPCLDGTGDPFTCGGDVCSVSETYYDPGLCESACTDPMGPTGMLGMAWATCGPQTICDADSHFFDAIQCGACAPENTPLLPTGPSNAQFTFSQNAGEVCIDNVFWIDPPVSTGFDYSVTGSQFEKVQMPSSAYVPDPDGYSLEYTESGNTQIVTLNSGEVHEFASPVTEFSIKGINPELELDPADTMAFRTGIDLAPTSTGVTITQTPITQNYTPPNNPPIANAGPDQTGQAPDVFNLDGTGSSDPDGDSLTFHWTQISGPNNPLNNPQTATPSTYTWNVTSPTSMVFELKVEDSNGAMSAPDQVELTMMPPDNMDQCTPWNRDRLVEAINFYPEGSGYSVTQTITGQVENDLQDWADNIASQHPDLGRFEIKSYINDVGTGSTPETFGSNIAAMPPTSRNFTSPATPAPAPFWTGGHFQANNWYRLDTKINIWRGSNGYSYDDVYSSSDAYTDQCVYQTVYFKIDASTGQLQARQKGGFRYTPRPIPPRLVFSDGTNAIGTVKYPQRPKTRDIKFPVDLVPTDRPRGRPDVKPKDPIKRPPVRRR